MKIKKIIPLICLILVLLIIANQTKIVISFTSTFGKKIEVNISEDAGNILKNEKFENVRRRTLLQGTATYIYDMEQTMAGATYTIETDASVKRGSGKLTIGIYDLNNGANATQEWEVSDEDKHYQWQLELPESHYRIYMLWDNEKDTPVLDNLAIYEE